MIRSNTSLLSGLNGGRIREVSRIWRRRVMQLISTLSLPKLENWQEKTKAQNQLVVDMSAKTEKALRYLGDKYLCHPNSTFTYKRGKK